MTGSRATRDEVSVPRASRILGTAIHLGGAAMSDAEVRRRDSRDLVPSVGRGASAGLPPDLVAKAGKRLALAAMIYASVYALTYGSGRFTQAYSIFWETTGFTVGDAISLAFIFSSVLMFFVARSGRIDAYLLLDVGLVFEVIAAAGIDVHLAFRHGIPGAEAIGLSWTCVWMVFFPLIVPSTPGKTLLAAVGAASMGPLMYLIGVARGGPPLAPETTFQFFLPNYICVGIALIGSRVVFRLGSDISRARRMGAYRLVEKLGEGGMGEVWKAEHRMLARPAAIKLIRSDPGGSSLSRTPSSHLHRFEREVQATSQLRSPHTVEVYDYGLTEYRGFYYVMELLDGLSLEELVQRHGPLCAERVIHVLTQACHSLSEAHANGLVHRDIKPANVFLCRYGLEHDWVKVLDFGLVKQSGDSKGSKDPKLTDIGAFAGTPAYGSPETALGDGDAVDGRSDLYSLGCVGFWLLTGTTVFRAANPMQMLLQHVHEEPRAPSRCTELPVPPALDAVILSCLRKDPAERPASAADFAAELQRISVERPWTAERAREWWDRHRLRHGSATAGVAAAAPETPSMVQPLEL